MPQVTFQRTPKEQIEVMRSRLQQLERTLPTTNNRAAHERRFLVRMLRDDLEGLAANLKHIEETGELKTF